MSTWTQYTKAYQQVLMKTNTPWAPWYVVPANHKWYRDLVVSTAILDALKSMKMQYPPPSFDLSNLRFD